jgi:exopolysaccharide production protein ExoQ
MRAYGGGNTIMGMASSRNTGFARYAAISALWILPGILRKGKLSYRVGWGVLLAASVYALVLANGRTETLAFIASLVIVLAAEKARRLVYLLAGIGAAIILGLRGFYSDFYLYFTRTGHLDLTMTGRTAIWEEGWKVLMSSPWVGSGFQADRLLMGGLHMHNAFLHALAQSGLLGGGAIIIGVGIVWYYTMYYFFLHQPADKSLIPAEIPAILLFTTVSSITESTFAYYSAAWLLSAPIVAYVMALHQYMERVSRKVAQDRGLRVRLARSKSRDLGPEVPPSPSGGEVLS